MKRCGLCTTNKCMEGTGVCSMCWQDVRQEYVKPRYSQSRKQACPCGHGELHHLCTWWEQAS